MRYILIILFLFNVASAQSLFGVVASDGGCILTDSSAIAFANTAGITNCNQKRAIRYLVKALKDSSLWSKMDAIYPMVGGTSSSHSYNLKGTASFQITWNNNPTHNSDGVSFNSASLQWGQTNYTPSNLNNLHISYYTKTNNTTGSQVPIGAINLSNPSFSQINITAANFLIGDVNTIISFTNSDTRGYYIATRTSSTSVSGYKNSSLIGTNTNTNAFSTTGVAISLGARRTSASGTELFSSHQCAFSSIGQGLNATESRALNNIVTQYQTILGRQN